MDISPSKGLTDGPLPHLLIEVVASG